MLDRHPHPSQQPLLPLTMVVSLALALTALKTDGKYSALVAAFGFALFLVAFALYGYAWIRRDADDLRESRRDRTDA